MTQVIGWDKTSLYLPRSAGCIPVRPMHSWSLQQNFSSAPSRTRGRKRRCLVRREMRLKTNNSGIRANYQRSKHDSHNLNH